MSAYIEKLAQLSTSGQAFVSVTVAEAHGSTPQDAGSKMLVDQAGLRFGTVGGGKIEAKAIEVSKAMVRDRSTPETLLVTWNLKRDVGMTCGGTVSLLFEAYNMHRWEIAIFGAGHVANAIASLLISIPCQLTIVDSRVDWLSKMPVSSQLRTIATEDTRSIIHSLDDKAFILCMTMGHSTDRPILRTIFQSGRTFSYVGVIGSRAKRAVLVKELAEDGIPSNLTDQIICPIGLDLGSNHPGEIAISVAAQLLEVKKLRCEMTEQSLN